MKIGFVVDGKSEVASLPQLFPALRQATGHEFVNSVLAHVPPDAPIRTLVRALAIELTRQASRGLDLVVILLDREQRPACSGQLAEEVRRAVRRDGIWACRVDVVIKDRTYENWLVADPPAMKAQRQRFRVSRTIERSIVPNKADGVDAETALKSCVIGDSYDKHRDSGRILAHADPLRMAANSRSFRRFLHCVGHPDYLDQSREPHAPQRA